MPSRVIDDATAVAPWSVFEADGVTPAADLAVAAVPGAFPLRPGPHVRLSGGTASSGSFASRAFAPAEDLSGFEELRLVWRAAPAAGPGADAPFWGELQFGSAALLVGDPGNTWRRRLPVGTRPEWQTLRLSLEGLPAAARSAVSELRLTVLDDTRPFRADIAVILAARPAIPADVDEALMAALHQRLSLGGAPVPAEVQVAGAGPGNARPLISVIPYGIRFGGDGRDGAETASDFDGAGYSLRAPPLPVDLAFAVEALAGNRADQAAMVDFVLGALPVRGSLLVAGQAFGCDWIDEPTPASGGFPIDRQLLHYRVRAWRDGGSPRPVRTVDTIVETLEQRESVDG